MYSTVLILGLSLNFGQFDKLIAYRWIFNILLFSVIRPGVYPEFIPENCSPDSQQWSAGFSVSLPGVLFPGKPLLSDNLEQPNLPLHPLLSHKACSYEPLLSFEGG